MAGESGWEQALKRLEPLDAQLDAALAEGDAQAALRLAFDGASDAVSLLADPSAGPGVHRVYVEFTPLPLVVHADGTMGEQRTCVNLMYQRWDVVGGAA